MAKKLYAVTNKDGFPKQFGNARKSAWTAPRWVNYHIGPSRWDVRNGNTQGKTANFDVHVIDFETNTMSKMSGVAFYSMHQNPDAIRNEIKTRLGLDADLQTLESLVRTKMLSENAHYLVVQFLQSKGINC